MRAPRRGLLRGLATLPLIGGGVVVTGKPTRAAEPVTDVLLNSYDEWLFFERKLLRIERRGWERSTDDTDFITVSPAHNFHFPLWLDDGPVPPWRSIPQPSTRAAIVLATVGCPWTYATKVERLAATTRLFRPDALFR